MGKRIESDYNSQPGFFERAYQIWYERQVLKKKPIKPTPDDEYLKYLKDWTDIRTLQKQLSKSYHAVYLNLNRLREVGKIIRVECHVRRRNGKSRTFWRVNHFE